MLRPTGRWAAPGTCPRGSLLGATTGDVQVLVADVVGEYLAVGGVCPHASCLLSDGWLEGEAVECGCHGSVFSVRTGEAVQGPAQAPLPTHPVRVEGGEIQVRVR
jgi:3-phenylpropionate/trans-cinnamate dioxygenase ferredoxin subunit